MRLVSTQLQLLQADPDTPRVLNGEGIMRLTARDLNTPTLALKTPEQLQAEQRQQQQAQAALNGHAQLQSLAGAAKDGSQALVNASKAGVPMAQAA